MGGESLSSRALHILGGQDRSWVLDETAHVRRDHRHPAYVSASAAKVGADPTPDVELLRDMGLDAGSTLVDLGAGAGRLALAVAPLCSRVVAVDVSPEMVALVRAAASASRATANVECVHGGFLSYEHLGPPAHFVYSRNSLHHLPDFWKAVALRRIADMLDTGGVFRLRDLVFSFTPSQIEDRVMAWLDTEVSQPVDGWTRSELERHLREEYSTFSWLLEPMLEQAGFDILEASYSDSGIYAAYTCALL